MDVLLVDNYDSYTYNLFQLLATTFGVAPHVVTNDAAELRTLDLDRFDAVVVSPGPGRPQVPRDIGHVLDVVRRAQLPTLGVCLGHQALALLGGADVVPAPQPRHGHLERIKHVGTDLFAGLPQEFVGVRYHSLCVDRPLPEGLRELAWAGDGTVMAMRHVDHPWWGVQFHPESVATECGRQLLLNFADLAGLSDRGTRRPRPSPRPVSGDGARRTGTPARRTLVRSFERRVDTQAVYDRLFADSRYALWLDSSRVTPGHSRFSFLGESAGPLAEVITADVGTGVVEIRRGSGPAERTHGSVFDVLDEALARHAPAATPDLPFDLDAGYVGFFGYELKNDCGSTNRYTSPMADAMWMLATRLVAVDHETDRAWLVALAGDDEPSTVDAERWLDAASAVLRDSPRPIPQESCGDSGQLDPEPWLDRDMATYLHDVETCLTKLREGESYEICLTTTAHLPLSVDVHDHYRRLRITNPAPYAALLRFDDTAIMCSSPERFLKVGRDRVAESKPIKGTARRGVDEVEDAQLSTQLSMEAKTRAENLMIVDLVRNDLGRVCAIGSVEVPQLMQVESYATMHQLVSTVRGRLRDDVTAVQAARACFPGGSMTGAPKLRTMEIIDNLERGPRGVYSGSIGYFGLSGAADLNIVIRTAVSFQGQLHVGAGGAIVLDSDPTEEYEEMLLKARVTLRGLSIDETGVRP